MTSPEIKLTPGRKTLSKSRTPKKSKRVTKRKPRVKKMTPEKFRAELLVALKELGDYLAFTGDYFRSRAYIKAYETIMALDPPPSSPDDLSAVSGVGETIIEKARTIYEGGIPDALKRAREDPALIFAGIHGIGGKKAVELVKKYDVKSIADLRARADEVKLNDVQKKGLLYYEDFQKRIPRGEIDKHNAKISKLMAKTYPDVEWSIVGSYRRGARNSGDIDVIIREKEDGETADLLKNVVEQLESDGYIIDRLALGKKKFMGVSKIGSKGTPRRLDMMVTPISEY